jgi:hypothetical protein
MSRCSNETGSAGAFAGRQYAISDFTDDLFQQEAKDDFHGDSQRAQYDGRDPRA